MQINFTSALSECIIILGYNTYHKGSYCWETYHMVERGLNPRMQLHVVFLQHRCQFEELDSPDMKAVPHGHCHHRHQMKRDKRMA